MAPTPDLSLLDAVRAAGYDAAVITTYSAYLPFFESVVLPRLRASGCKHVVVLIDSRHFSTALHASESAPRLAGRFYTLIPVISDGAFHPKILLLVGKSKGLVHIGSHNLSLGGFGLNRELTGAISIASGDSEAAQIAATVWRAIWSWAARTGNPIGTGVMDALTAVQSFAPWLDKLMTVDQGHALLVQSSGAGQPTLWHQLDRVLPQKVLEISVVGAFFDSKLEFLRAVQDRYPKTRLLVGVEPSSVQFVGDIKRTEEYAWRDASKLATRDGYLHAKALYFAAKGGDDVLVFGSANPSAPAWMAGPAKNDECVLVLSGSTATSAAKKLGLDVLRNLPAVSRAELAASIKRSREEDNQQDPIATAPGFVAVLENGEIHVPSIAISGAVRIVRGLSGNGNECWSRRVRANQAPEDLVISDLANDDLEIARLKVENKDGSRVFGVLHRRAEIAELSRTGKQRALQDALDGLRGETTNLADLISVVDKAIFDGARDQQSSAHAKGGTKPGKTPIEHPRPESLVVDLAAKKRAKSYARLHLQNPSITLLLDLLNREMRLTPTGDVVVDSKGRSEEEAVGQDDGLDPLQGVDDYRIAALCRGKVKRVVNRMIAYLSRASQDSNPASWVDALLKLLAVLMLLRELRLIEQERRWRLIREVLVPSEQRLSLLEGIMPPLFGRDQALLRRLVGYLQYEKIEDLSRLKGMLLWLAWDSGVRLEERMSLLDDPDEIWTYLFDKAVLLATAQLIPNDGMAIREALSSIERCATLHQKQAAANWWQGVRDWITEIERTIENVKVVSPRSEIRLGDVALVPAEKHSTLRVVRSASESVVSMIDFGAERQNIDFQRARVSTFHL